MRLPLLCVLLAGCSGEGTGTVVYSEGGTGHIMTVDVATGAKTALDLGFFANVAISPDRQHVAYMGENNIPKVSDLSGTVTELPSTNGCSLPLTWRANSTLTYCIVDNFMGFSSVGFLPGAGAPVRTLMANSIAVSSDGARIAYLLLANPNTSALGDLVIEDANGANRKRLAAAVQVDRIAFTPDDGALVISSVDMAHNFIEHVSTVSLDGTITDLGEAMLVEPLPNGARFSPDGHEILAVAGNRLVALDLASGSQRPFAMAGGNVTIIGAAFLAADRIVYSRQDSTFMGDVGGVTSTVRFSDGADKVTLASSDGSSQCQVTDVAAAAGQVELVCAVPAIVDLDGKLITSRNAAFALGISGDHAGMITVDMFGTIEYVSDTGSVRALATANTSSLTPSLPGPYAAYAP